MRVRIRAMLTAMMLATVACTSSPAPGPGSVAQLPAPKQQIVDGRNTISFIPAKPRAIIYLFHGSGGSEAFATNPTTQRALARFVAAGYAYASSASLQRTDPRRWDLTATSPAQNPDVAYMLAWHKQLVSSGQISATTPVFTMGMSNGGGMANLFGHAAKEAGLPLKAVADYMGPFLAAIPQAAKPAPTFVVVVEHDGLVSTPNVLANADRLKQAGVTIETHLAKEKTLQPDAFTVIAGVDAAASKAIFADLVTRGLIDSSGKRLIFAGQSVISREDEARLQTMLAPGEQQRAVSRVLLETWAAHMMRADYADQQFAFFEAALKR